MQRNKRTHTVEKRQPTKIAPKVLLTFSVDDAMGGGEIMKKKREEIEVGDH